MLYSVPITAQVGERKAPMQDFHVTHTGKKLMREQCYGPQDLALGAFIHVYGRDFFIHDADDFTKQWYSVSPCAITTWMCASDKLPVTSQSPQPHMPIAYAIVAQC